MHSCCLNNNAEELIDTVPFNSLFFKTTWVSWHQKRNTNLHFNEARDEVAAASAGPYANHLQLIPDR